MTIPADFLIAQLRVLVNVPPLGDHLALDRPGGGVQLRVNRPRRCRCCTVLQLRCRNGPYLGARGEAKMAVSRQNGEAGPLDPQTRPLRIATRRQPWTIMPELTCHWN